jgi:hypothetical protein
MAISLGPAGRGSTKFCTAATMTDVSRCSVELDAIRDAMAALAVSRLADTSAWVHTSWAALRALESLGQGPARWPPPR